jgi:hypothetical protein
MSPVEDVEENNNLLPSPFAEDDDDDVANDNNNAALQYLAQDGLDMQRERETWQVEEWRQLEAVDEDDEDEANEGCLIGACEARFRASQCNMRLLFVMAYRLMVPNGRIIADWEGHPYSSVKKTNKKTFKPTKNQLWAEIEHQADELDVPIPRIKSSGMDVKKEWLCKNPQTKTFNVAFLREHEEQFMKTCIEAEEEDKA